MRKDVFPLIQEISLCSLLLYGSVPVILCGAALFSLFLSPLPPGGFQGEDWLLPVVRCAEESRSTHQKAVAGADEHGEQHMCSLSPLSADFACGSRAFALIVDLVLFKLCSPEIIVHVFLEYLQNNPYTAFILFLIMFSVLIAFSFSSLNPCLSPGCGG